MYKINIILIGLLIAINLNQNKNEKMYQDSELSVPKIIDGPYVLYQNDSVFVNYIENNGVNKSVRVDSKSPSQKDDISLVVNTDIPGLSFNVKLKSKLTNEKSEYNNVKKMLVISDIEGNFTALRKLLQANHVINEAFDWTFGKDHLVLVGDFIDRGKMVTEVLWLIYALEEKAKKAGGYVHFILGNHEIMNMSNDLRYVPEEYLQHAALMNKPYMQLFGSNSEIGRWLATKNIMERIGNTLFVHGGISAVMNSMAIPIKELNKISKPFYTDTVYEYKDTRLGIVFGNAGPFWYRGYYLSPKASIEQIDSTLSFYGVRHISTGHTIIASEIRSLYDGKLFNTDVHHADGHSEALLIENGKFWRLTDKGEKLAVNPY
jgi:hypothetical protein